MIEFEINGSLSGVNFAPNSTTAEVIQNVRTIIATRKGTVPNDRNFGISWDFIDRPINQARAMFSEEVAKQVRSYEPRAEILEIDLKPDTSGAIAGKLKPVVVIGVNE